MAHPRIDVGMYVVAKPPLDRIDAAVSSAREQQFDSLFIWDHLQDFFSSSIWDEEFSWQAAESESPHEWLEFQTLLGYMAGAHPGIRLGVGVTEPIRRHPVLLAQAALTLAHLTQQAPILGIGTGEHIGADPVGLEVGSAVGRLEEALQILHRCFESSEPIDFEGEHFQLNRAVVGLPVPKDRRPELWVAAHGPRMLRLTGRYGDGWYPFAVATPDDYASRLDVIQGTAREAGRDPAAITPALHPITVVAPTEEEARELLKTRPVRYYGLFFPDAVWQLFGKRHPLGENFGGFFELLPESYDRQTIDAAIDAVPQELVEALFWGTPEQLVSRFRAFGEAGLRHVVPIFASAASSPEAAAYSQKALGWMAHELRNGETLPA